MSGYTIDRFKGQCAFLSNFHPCVIEHKGITYPSVEHAYQAMKVLSVAERKRIAELPTARDAKRRGKQLRLRLGWDSIRDSIMLLFVRKKFADPALRGMLLKTGDRKLIEGNWWRDTYWGVCRGEGQNRLGKILMRVRGECRREEKL